MNKKKPKNIYMTEETKERLNTFAAKKHYQLGECIEYMLDVVENEIDSTHREVLSLTKQNKKLLSVIEEHVEITNILFNALAKTMELSVRDNEDSFALTQAKEILAKKREASMIAAMNQKKYSNYSVDDE
ncbi:hypothetical protein ACFJYA_13830 [Enterococcus faecalis]